MKVISILIPTMGRPARLVQAIDSICATAGCPEAVEILVRVSATDPALEGYNAVTRDRADIYTVAGADTYGEGIEFLRTRARGDILFAGADDALFRTPGWDIIVREAFDAVPDGLLVAYANNGLNREKCEHFFTSRRWINTLGYMVWPEFRHFCVDQWVAELATGLGRLQFLRGVVVEHLHKKYGKAPDDATYQLVRGATRTSEKDNELYAQRADVRAHGLRQLQAARYQ